MAEQPRQVLAGPVLSSAAALLGARIISQIDGQTVAVRLSEVEAYGGTRDPGAHSFKGKTARTSVMFGPPGFAYVYFVYGMHWCLNVVCGPDGQAAAVLLRAGQVVVGEQVARARRPAHRAVSAAKLASGPARLAACLGVTGQQYGVDLLDPGSPLRLQMPEAALPSDQILTGPRVGVGGAGADYPWRYWIATDPSVSAYRPAPARPRKG